MNQNDAIYWTEDEKKEDDIELPDELLKDDEDNEVELEDDEDDDDDLDLEDEDDEKEVEE